MKNVTELSSSTVADLRAFDIILCTYRCLYSSVYAERMLDFQCQVGMPTENPLNQLKEETWRWINGGFEARKLMAEGFWMEKSRSVTAKRKAKWLDEMKRECLGNPEDKSSGDPDQLLFPVFEQCYFRRVVLDEFHETEALDGKTGVLMWLRSRYRWGLTGTPSVESVDGVRSTAALFNIDLVCSRKDRINRHYRHSADTGDDYKRSWIARTHTPSAKAAELKDMEKKNRMTFCRISRAEYERILKRTLEAEGVEDRADWTDRDWAVAARNERKKHLSLHIYQLDSIHGGLVDEGRKILKGSQAELNKTCFSIQGISDAAEEILGKEHCPSKILCDNARNFVNTFIRQNSWFGVDEDGASLDPVEQIRVKNHACEVVHSEAEKLLY